MKTDEFGLTRRDALALDAAKLYAEALSQQEIADLLHVTRPTVSKLLTHAKARGFLKLVVDDPRESDQYLARRLQDKYGINDAVLVSPMGYGPVDLRRALGRAAAKVLQSRLIDGDTVGVSWSETIAELFFGS